MQQAVWQISKHHQLSQPHAPKQKINATKISKCQKESGEETAAQAQPSEKTDKNQKERDKEQYPKREAGSRRESRGEIVRGETLHKTEEKAEKADKADKPIRADKPKSEKTEKLPHQKRPILKKWCYM